jgi:hypothetical protein
MSKLNNGPISSNDLMSKLVQAKKLMNKVDTGDFERGNIDESKLIAPSNDSDYLSESYEQNQPQVNTRPVGTPTADRIQQSKLPDAIKKAMIENPIPQISLSDSLDMDFVKGAKRLMEQEGVQPKQTQKKQSPQPTGNASGVNMNALATLIENTVRKVMDEKLSQILTAQQTSTINENLVLKVGDSIFKGKITGVNKAK